MSQQPRRIGTFCAYTPLALIDAAGFEPYRILPLGDAPDQAGELLHDNLCPEVKRVLDRALADALPPLAGVVLVDSCDAMRRLADAWRAVRPEPLAYVDLPMFEDARAVDYLATELRHLADTLAGWAGRPIDPAAIVASQRRYDELAQRLAGLAQRAAEGGLPGGRRALQDAFNRSVAGSVTVALAAVADLEGTAVAAPERPTPGVPLFVFGNVLPDPDSFGLLEDCGARVVDDDLCTGTRQLTPLQLGDGDVYHELAGALLRRPACARTFSPAEPGRLAAQVVEGARAAGARGVVAHVMKFCDPYLARLPAVRGALERAGLPLLVLEGDCTMRSLGQHQTRIEAFVEMLEEVAPS